jgi:hypothetical protein
MRLKVILESLRCERANDGDSDEVFCNIYVGEGLLRRHLGTVNLGDWKGGDDRRVDAILWQGEVGSPAPLEFNFKDSDAAEVEEDRYAQFTFRDPLGADTLFDSGECLGVFTVAPREAGVEYGAKPGTEHHGPTAAGSQEFHLKGNGASYRLFVRDQLG